MIVNDYSCISKRIIVVTLEILTYILIWIPAMIFDNIKASTRDIPPNYNVVDISYPHKPDTIPFYGVVIGCAILCIICFLSRIAKFGWNSHYSYILLIRLFVFGFGLNEFFTSMTKVFIARFRPDFLARCFGNDRLYQLPYLTWIDLNTCLLNNTKLTNAGRVSFLSGHTSTAFCMAIMFGLHQIHILDMKLIKNNISNKISKYFMISMPIVLALAVGYSRIVDNRHHPTDVIAGAIVGSLCGLLSFVIFSYRNKKKNNETSHTSRV